MSEITELVSRFKTWVDKFGGEKAVTTLHFVNAFTMSFNIQGHDGTPGSTFKFHQKPTILNFSFEHNLDEELGLLKYYIRDSTGYVHLTTRSITSLEGVDFLPSNEDGSFDTQDKFDIRAVRS